MKKILVIGSLNMDITLRMERAPEAGETLTADSLITSPGGKGANQAYAAGKLGGDVMMLGAVGQDAYGEELCHNLASVGVDISGIRKIAGVSTGTAVIFVEHTGENRIVLVSGANSMVDRAYIDEHMDKIRDCEIVMLQLEIPLDTVIYAAKRAKEMGKTVILDPAPAIPNISAELLSCVDYIKPNETELNMILTGKTDSLQFDEALEQVQKLGVKNVWVTLGSQGVFLKESGRDGELIPSVRVTAVDTTAAGDTFTGYFLAGLCRGLPIRQVLTISAKAAAIDVSRKGAVPSIPSWGEVITAITTTIEQVKEDV